MKEIIIPEVLKNQPKKINNTDYNMNLNIKQNYNYSKNYNNHNITNNYNSKDKGFFGFLFLILSFPFKIIMKLFGFVISKLNLNINKKYLIGEYKKHKMFKKIKSRYDTEDEIW